MQIFSKTESAEEVLKRCHGISKFEERERDFGINKEQTDNEHDLWISKATNASITSGEGK